MKMSSSATSTGYDTDEEQEDDDHLHLPLSPGGLLVSHLELPDLTACMVHEISNKNLLDVQFPELPERTITNVEGERAERGRSIYRKTDRIIKELNNLKRQNVITHCLMGTLIFITLGWQLSEVSLILALKNGFTHPFRFIGNFLSRMVRRRTLNDSVDATKEESSALSSLVPVETPQVLGLKMPELPKFLDISKWGQNQNIKWP